CDALTEIALEDRQPYTEWMAMWKAINEASRKHLLLHSETDHALTEGGAVRSLFTVTPEGSSVYVGNSMTIGDVDTCFCATSKNVHVLGNRGAKGIDGMVSSGIGAAAASNEPVTLLLGDLSFFHDMNGLLAAKTYQLNITILVINNNG